jgi:DMSO/TMAO reductase YedYZ molybdopterin-dependent catalytic subunit
MAAIFPIPHGAPVRLRVERQLGYKHLKFLSTITVTDSAAEWGEGKGSQGAENGYPGTQESKPSPTRKRLVLAVIGHQVCLYGHYATLS